MVPYTQGILHRNFRGRWYPVCDTPKDWAKEACESEMGDLTEYDQLCFHSNRKFTANFF